MKLVLWLVVFLLGQSLVSSAAFASATCSKLFKTEQATETKTESIKPPSKKELNSMVKEIAGLIEKTGRTPTEKEIASELEVPVEAVKAFLSKKTSPDIVSMVAIAKQSYPEIFKTYEAKMAKVAADYLLKNLALPSIKELADALDVSQKDIQTIYGGNKDILNRIAEYETKALERITDALVRVYVKAAKIYGRNPTLEEMAEVENSKFTLEALEGLIGKNRLIRELSDLHKMAERKNPKSLKGVIDLEVYNDQKLAELLKDLRVGERIVVTSSIAGAPSVEGFLGALKKHAELENAPVFVRPVNNETTGLDPIFNQENFTHVMISEIGFSKELVISNIPIVAKQLNPLMGLKRLGHRGTSMIVASPKLHLEVVPTLDNVTNPHILMTTGSINHSNVYQGKRLISGRTDYIAELDHMIGAVILEKTAAQDDLVGGPSIGTFHIRHIMYDKERQGFMDLNKFYTAQGVTKQRIAAVAFGDTHVAQHDHRLSAQTRKQIMEEFEPEVYFFHDWFDGRSISHYERDKAITLAMKAQKGQLNLKDELDSSVDYLKGVLNVAPPGTVLVIVEANHNSWLHRHLEAGQFMKEPHNTAIGLELANVMMTGRNPLEYYVEKSLGSKYARRILFLKAGEQNQIGSNAVTMSEHGDKGANGAKGGMNSFINGTDRSAFGHSHTVIIRNYMMNIGTNGVNPAPYAQGGFSNWVQALSIIDHSGSQQLLMYKNGEWYRDKSRPLPPPEEFFEEGFPFAKPHNKPTTAEQVDQYSK